MSENGFTITCASDWRPETPAEIGLNVQRTLDAISAISPLFHSWGIVDLEGEPKEEGFLLDDVRGRFTEIVERGIYTEEGRAAEAGGYTVVAFNDGRDPIVGPLSASLRFHGGGVRQLSSRGVSFDTPDDQIPHPGIVSYPVFRSILLVLTRIWDVSSAQVTSSDLMQSWDDPPFNFDLAWMVYLSAPLAAQIAVPRSATVERTANGILLIAAEETFDTDNPSHMDASRRIRDALAPINDLPRHERMKQKLEEEDRMLAATGFPGKRVSSRDRD